MAFAEIVVEAPVDGELGFLSGRETVSRNQVKEKKNVYRKCRGIPLRDGG